MMEHSKLINYREIIFNRRIINFAVNVSLLLLVTVFCIQKIESSLVNFISDGKVKYLLKGIIQNPRALLISSEINKKSGNLDEAIIDIELAIALIELNGKNSSINKVEYYKALDDLKIKKR